MASTKTTTSPRLRITTATVSTIRLRATTSWYDFLQEIDCAERRREDQVPLYGDQTYYWIFNDKGNIHSESQGEPIGMEIRAQAFAFSTNDEVNNMQFYNYVLINQGTQTLTDTYFAQWVDCDEGPRGRLRGRRR